MSNSSRKIETGMPCVVFEKLCCWFRCHFLQRCWDEHHPSLKSRPAAALRNKLSIGRDGRSRNLLRRVRSAFIMHATDASAQALLKWNVHSQERNLLSLKNPPNHAVTHFQHRLPGRQASTVFFCFFFFFFRFQLFFLPKINYFFFIFIFFASVPFFLNFKKN